MSSLLSRMFPKAKHTPTRVGLLNTGELIVVHSTGESQLISKPTTDLIAAELRREAARQTLRDLAEHGIGAGAGGTD